MSTLIECQELIDVVVGTIAKLKGGSSGGSHSFNQKEECELYDGFGPLTFEQLPPKVSDALSILLSPLNNDLIPEHQQFQRDWSGNFLDKNNGRSDGDLTLCGSLARAGLQSKEIDMAFRASGRYREKWEREDYRLRTISLAMMQFAGSANDEETPLTAAPNDWLSEMNENRALVRTGRDLFVMDFRTPNASTHGTGYGPELMKISTLKLMLAGQYVSVGEGKSVPKAVAWLNHCGRRQYEGVAYAPGQNLSPKLLNLWQGFPVQPILGDVSPWLTLVNFQIPNKNLATWIVYWIAWRVQNLDQVPGTVLIFQGLKGAGKNSLFEPVISFFGNHAMVADDPELIIGRFNWHLMMLSFVVLDEAVFAGDLRHADKLKSRVTATHMSFEAKGMTPVKGVNRCAYVMLTNHPHVWQATLDERRAVVVNVADTLRGDFDFWNQYYAWCKLTGPANLLHYLLSLDVTSFNPRQIPQGTGIEEQIALTALRDPVIAWWHQCLSENCIRWFDGMTKVVELESDNPTVIERVALRLSYEQSAGVRSKHTVAWDVVAKRLRQWCQPYVIEDSRKKAPGGKRPREYVLPSLNEMQVAFTEQTGLKF